MKKSILLAMILIAMVLTEIKMVIGNKNGKTLTNEHNSVENLNKYVLALDFKAKDLASETKMGFFSGVGYLLKIAISIIPFIWNVLVISVFNFAIFNLFFNLTFWKWVSFLWSVARYELAIVLMVVTALFVWKSKKIFIYDESSIFFWKISKALAAIVVLILHTWVAHYIPWFIVCILVDLGIGFVARFLIQKLMGFSSRRYFKRLDDLKGFA